MPNLMRLSMCETRIANLLTTAGVLSKLPALMELRFQSCLCCKDTGPCPDLQRQHNLQSEVSIQHDYNFMWLIFSKSMKLLFVGDGFNSSFNRTLENCRFKKKTSLL